MPTQKTTATLLPTGTAVHYVLAAFCLVFCCAGIWFAARIGLARLLGEYGATANNLLAVNEAVRLSSFDAANYLAKAQGLQSAGQLVLALPEYERATTLQPNNFALWLELGIAYDLAGKPEAAIAAVKRAIAAAPYYAQPHWQLGNLLLRQGKRDDAFIALRQAMSSDPALVPNAVELAWGAYAGNAVAVEQALQPATPLARLELARVFAARGAVDDAMRLYRAVADYSDTTAEVREKMRRELFQAKHFYAAWEVWAGARAQGKQGIAAITNNGFEEPISLSEESFGWRLNPEKNTVNVALDGQEPFAGKQSLQLRWDGKSFSSVYVASQLVLVEPGKRYRLNFAARTKDIVSGGLPELAILSDFEGQLLSAVDLPAGTTPWKTYTAAFTAPVTSRVVVIAIRRKACLMMPCPAFGTIWLDGFSLQ